MCNKDFSANSFLYCYVSAVRGPNRKSPYLLACCRNKLSQQKKRRENWRRVSARIKKRFVKYRYWIVISWNTGPGLWTYRQRRQSLSIFAEIWCCENRRDKFHEIWMSWFGKKILLEEIYFAKISLVRRKRFSRLKIMEKTFFYNNIFSVLYVFLFNSVKVHPKLQRKVIEFNHRQFHTRRYVTTSSKGKTEKSNNSSSSTNSK